jgi:hypothetical protein
MLRYVAATGELHLHGFDLSVLSGHESLTTSLLQSKHGFQSARPELVQLLRLHNSLCKQHNWCEDLVISERVYWCHAWERARAGQILNPCQQRRQRQLQPCTTMKGSVHQQLPKLSHAAGSTAAAAVFGRPVIRLMAPCTAGRPGSSRTGNWSLAIKRDACRPKSSSPDGRLVKYSE